MPPLTATLRAYLGVTRLFPRLVLRPTLRAHATQGADPARLQERHGHATARRPDGPLVWVHAASVGEFLAIRDLLADLASVWPEVAILVTTTSATGAAAVARSGLPRAIHQFLPADTVDAIGAFLGHWKPDLAMIVESDLWPRMVTELHARGVPAALLNVRRSRTRTRLPRSSAALLSCFDLITTQDAEIAQEIMDLGIPASRVLATGDLKSDADPLPDQPASREAMAAIIGNRPLWSAISTHEADESTVLQAQANLIGTAQGTLLIMVPRHPDRATGIEAACKARGLSVARRSLGQMPVADTAVYLADTIGETGVFFRLAPIVFMGGSMGDEGGHNPYEPLRLGAAILHGPGVRHFAQVYARLDAEGAARRIADTTELAGAVARWLSDPDELGRAVKAGRRCLAEFGGARKATLARLLALAGRDA